ncbi:hypothetical protein L7F22_015271 [Adiantum nelumboides]|nr:hypothetical protein [Adiantum nelumboides]
MTAQLKAELVPLERKIHAFMAKDMLKLVHEGLRDEGKAMKEACKQEVSTAVENEIQKSKEAIAAMEASVSKVQENVEKKVHTWAEMAKDAVDKEVKECVPWIEVVKENKGMPSNQMEVMNATLEEEAKWKVIEDVKVTVSQAVEPVERGITALNETLQKLTWMAKEDSDDQHVEIGIEEEKEGDHIEVQASYTVGDHLRTQ